MKSRLTSSEAQTLCVLHVAFALTGVLHAMGGPLLPSIVAAFRLSDTQAGGLLSLYFAGTSIGALLCAGRYARLLTFGLLGTAGVCVAIAAAQGALSPLFLALGAAVGVPMTTVSMYAGRMFASRSAAPLTLLNFSWSIGALAAPLFAARVLVNHSYRAAYLVAALAALLAALGSALLVREPERKAPPLHVGRGTSKLGLIALFTFLILLEIGIENASIAWLATYCLRRAGSGAALAAASSSLYWWGFLASRGLSWILLLRADALRVLRGASVVALAAAATLIGFSGSAVGDISMLVLGIGLGPIFPLILSHFFARARNASDSRWVLAIGGFGGSTVPWLIGFVSNATGNLRFGLMVIPAALALMVCILAALRNDPLQPEAA